MRSFFCAHPHDILTLLSRQHTASTGITTSYRAFSGETFFVSLWHFRPASTARQRGYRAAHCCLTVVPAKRFKDKLKKYWEVPIISSQCRCQGNFPCRFVSGHWPAASSGSSVFSPSVISAGCTTPHSQASTSKVGKSSCT